MGHRMVVLATVVFASGFFSSAASAPSGIMLAPGSKTVTVITKNAADDCRVVRGFNGAPVDGSVRSWTYIGWIIEYPGSSRDFIDPLTGVNYWYNGNDGVHVTLHDPKGFDAVVLRGGAKTRMYTGSSSIDEQTDRKPLHTFPGGDAVAAVRLPQRQKADKVSFFGTHEGRISDAAFYLIEERNSLPDQTEAYAPASDHLNISIPRSASAPQSIYRALNERYGDTDWTAHTLIPDNGSSQPVRMRAGEALHLITEEFDIERGLASVAFDLSIAGPKEAFTLTAAVQDPLDPRLDLAWAPLRCTGEGRYTFCLDIPDQVLLKGSQLWVTLICDTAAVLSGPGGGGPRMLLSFKEKSAVLDAAVRHRMFLLKHFFQLLC